MSPRFCQIKKIKLGDAYEKPTKKWTDHFAASFYH